MVVLVFLSEVQMCSRGVLVWSGFFPRNQKMRVLGLGRLASGQLVRAVLC